jgi:hypothetical protein
MPGADDWARASEDAHLEWPSADAGDGEGSDEVATTTRGFFLGQLPEDEPDDAWADERPDGGEGDGGDPDVVLEDGGQDLDPLATSFETELQAPVATADDETELSLAAAADEPTQVAAGAVPSVSARRIQREARRRRGWARLSRVAVVAGVVAALAAGTAVYVGTHAKADDQQARRSTSTSSEPKSSSTTPTTATTTAGSVAAPGTEPAPDPAGVPGSAAPASPQGRSSAPVGAPGGAAPTSPRAPGTTAAPPSSASPPNTPPPRSPMCQVLPVLCP